MRLDDLENSAEALIKKHKDGAMEKYISDVVASRYMPLRHNTSKKVEAYIYPMVEREGMIYGDPLYIEYIGELMDKKFGHNYRASSLYTTFFGDDQYGEHSYIVLPFGGEYDFCYSPDIHDMYHHLHQVKVSAFDSIYKLIKSGKVGNQQVLDVWDSMEYSHISEMKIPFKSYTEHMIDSGIDSETTKKVLDLFNGAIHAEYSKLLSTYNVTSSLPEVYKDIGKMYNPIIEVMVKSPYCLLISYDYIMKKYGDVDYFFDAIK